MKKNKLGERLRELRGDRSQSAVARLLGMPQQNWQRYESGTSEPSLDVLHEICVTLGASMDWLCGLDSACGAVAEPAGGGYAPAAGCAGCASRDRVIADQAAAMRELAAATAALAAASARKEGP